ncbi:uncharacterized protein LY89DRAFT_182388 [Mollisia scopiformis]|uniref:Uncharacterized protein n=1 Tax=Mollisia scopiformis TaxID=149040 RepID=A0A194XTR3_MOLSC|nr:uncharacterized protein LY89DRAFT_182388 [Mollisia scopiformis]KUJ23429.1 hypothetical protein LY89DRAFT_182388 [Mollisia scopiformis]
MILNFLNLPISRVSHVRAPSNHLYLQPILTIHTVDHEKHQPPYRPKTLHTFSCIKIHNPYKNCTPASSPLTRSLRRPKSGIRSGPAQDPLGWTSFPSPSARIYTCPFPKLSLLESFFSHDIFFIRHNLYINR